MYQLKLEARSRQTERKVKVKYHKRRWIVVICTELPCWRMAKSSISVKKNKGGRVSCFSCLTTFVVCNPTVA